MKEQLINFNTARAAQVAGFISESWLGYTSEGKLERPYYGQTYSNDDEENSVIYEAPTQALLQKWLREVHKIYIYCIPRGFEKADGRQVIRWGNNISIRKNKYSSTYEKALEKGLQEALKLIKK